MKRKLLKKENLQNFEIKNDEKSSKNAKNAANLSNFEDFETWENMDVNAKIIPFKVPRVLTDNDINSLFLGLVKLIKKSALEEVRAVEKTPKELLKQALEGLGAKTKELSSLKAEFEKLKTENKKLVEKLQENSRKDKKTALESHLAARRQKTDIPNAKRG